MFSLTKFLISRLIPTKFWIGGLAWIILIGISIFAGDLWSGLLALVIGFPIWVVYGAVCVYQETKSLKNELVTLGQETSLESLKDVEKRGEIIKSICRLAGCDAENPLVANYVFDTLVKAKSKVKHSAI